MRTPKVAAVTMVYGNHFLEKWVDHYSRQLGAENLFIISHGDNEFHREVCSATNHIVVPRKFDENFDSARITLINDFCNSLLEIYSAVIFTDADELVMVDPSLQMTLEEYLRDGEQPALAPIGMNLLTLQQGAEIDWKKPILEQAPLAAFSPGFSKPCIRRSRCRVHMGGHCMFDLKFSIDPNLWLFNLKFVDSSLHDRYDELIEELNSLDGEAVQTKGIFQWRGDKEKVQQFALNLRRASSETMKPQENTKGLLNVVKVPEKRLFHVDPEGRAPAFFIPNEFRHVM